MSRVRTDKLIDRRPPQRGLCVLCAFKIRTERKMYIHALCTKPICAAGVGEGVFVGIDVFEEQVNHSNDIWRI